MTSKNIEQLHEALAAKTIAELRAFASDQGIQLPSRGRKAELIALVIDLLSAKKPAEEEKVHTTTITLPCGHPHEVSHLNVFPKDVKAYLRKAEKEAECPRCPAAVAEPEPKPAKKAAEKAKKPAPAQAKKSSATPKAKPAKATKAPEPTRPVKKAARKDGREKSVEKHAAGSRRLLAARTGEEKAAIVEELVTALGTVWTADATTTSRGSKVVLKCGFERIEIKYNGAALESIWHHRRSQDQGRKLRNVSAVLQIVAKADKALPQAATARELTQVAA